ncbi:MAG TPA: DNRLRE domain-containing protein [Humisphaera sp.]|nr:DNRLRE domain-containing protein [Humisphaera sp.]
MSFVQALETRRLLSAGGLDPSFNGHGTATLNFGPITAAATAMAVQSDGKIVEVGYASDGSLAMARFNANGTPDTTFGPTHNGEVVTGYGGGDDIVPSGVAIQPDGKIVVSSDRSLQETFDVLRFLPDGSFDNAFDGDGVVNVSLAFDGRPDALTLQKDGKIVVVGGVLEGALSDNHDFEIVRLNTDGSLDGGFGNSGKTQVNFGKSEDANAVALDYNGTPASNPDYGHIVVAGGQIDFSNPGDTIAVARLNPDGTPDHTFDSDGQRLVNISSDNTAAQGIAIEGSGRIVLTGFDRPQSAPTQFMMVGLTNTGALDGKFGAKGVVRTPLLASGVTQSNAIVNGFANRLIVGGTSNNEFALAAYTLNGKLDTGFGNGGKVITAAFGGVSHGIVALALGPNRTIIAAGGDAFQTARYFDIGPSVAVTAINTAASEHGSQTGTFLVTRDQRLPFPTRVYFTIGGTATAPSLLSVKNHTNDYTLSGLTVPPPVILGPISHPFVDIPANAISTQVTLTPIDDKVIEGNETAIFTINTDPLYDLGTPKTATINIQDDVKTIKDIADAHVNDGANANANFGSFAQIKVKAGTTGQNRVAFLKFDLTGITNVNSVQLQLFGELSAASSSGVVTQIFPVLNSTWSETGITFNNKPAPSGSAVGSATITGTTPRLYTFDLTTFIKTQLALRRTVITLKLKNPSPSTPIVLFNSREAANNGPQLVIS